MKKEITLSIVVPAYNEEKIIKANLRKIVNYLQTRKYSWEIIVADDGSVDKTARLVRNFSNKYKAIRLVKLFHNTGKGGALREGVLAAEGKFVIFMDADLSVDLENIDKFLKELKKGSDVVIASRRIKGAQIDIHQPWLRENMGKVFTSMTRFIIGVPLADFTCGFKGFSRKSANQIFKAALINRWAYDAEIMFLAKIYKYKILEIPIHWKNREDTRVKLGGVVFETLRDLIRIKAYDFLGKYDGIS